MTIHTSTTVNSSARDVFAIITDLPTYHNWLEETEAFKGTTQVSHNPIRVGTTFAEPGPAGTKNGEVIELEAPVQGKTGRVTFKQPMSLKPYMLGQTVNVKVSMKVTEEGGATRVERDVNLSYPWAMWTFKPFIDASFKGESVRLLESLKTYAENVEKD